MFKPNFKEVPRGELIRENETIKLFSVFDFNGGAEELFSFLFGCKQLNCTVVFENEGITVRPDGDDDMQNLLLSFYAAVAKEPKIAKDYINYLTGKYLKRPT